MNTEQTICPVCQSADGFDCSASGFRDLDATLFDCNVCGRFAVSRTALQDYGRPLLPRLSRVNRSALSHMIRLQNLNDPDPKLWTTEDLDRVVKDGLRLPTPAQQATNIIRYVGDRVTEEGSPIEILPAEFSALVGSPSREFACALVSEMDERGLLNGLFLRDVNGPPHVQDLSLTLSGWQAYEAERQGLISGSYGFVALKFGDEILDPLLREHVKPALASLGYQVVDMRDVSKAGIIDNLLRVQIRDSAFVLVDLTHENAGAYWEAGYAEGLGKPVLYICERSKFEQKRTHFDTNHCTTVLWDVDDISQFISELIATLKRTLNI